ncbi:MAG: methyltransferase domain-containing protein [Bacteroidota bacterium]
MPQTTLTPFNETKKAQQFYRNIWGGDDLHVGLYKKPGLSLHEAGRKTTQRMLKLVPRIKKSSKALVLQSGFGTAARYLAREKKCKVFCLNDNQLQNAYNQGRIDELGLEKVINVEKGGVEYMPYEPNFFDFVLAQDSFSITASKRQLFRAIHRVLQPEGRMVFTALMRAEKLQPKAKKLIEKLPVEELISQKQYEKDARRGFFQQVYAQDLSRYLPVHFSKVLTTLEQKYDDLVVRGGQKLVDKRLKTYQLFQQLAEQEQLRWGIFVFQKLNA